MKQFIYVLFLFLLGAMGASAQFTAVTHLSGTATYSGHTVGVTSAGTASNISYCGTSPYWIGAGTGFGTPDPGSYTFTFSPAVNAIRVFVTAANPGESITATINGTRYSLTSSEVFTYTGTCGETSMPLSGDSLLADTAVSRSSDGAQAGGFMILRCGITSATIATNGIGNGSVFTLLISDTAGCSAATNNGPICLGDTLELNCIASGSGGTYKWSGPGGFSSTLQNPIRTNVSYADTGVYTVIRNGVDTLITRFLIKPNPDVTASFTAPVCEGASLLLTATSPIVGVNYNWSGPNSFTSTLQDPVINPLTAAASGSYIVTGELGGCFASDTVSVTVISIPTPTVASNTPVCEGDKIQFISTSSLSGVTYGWSGPAGFTSALQNPEISPATPANAGTYALVVSAFGCNSAPASVTVNVIPVPVITLTYTDPTPCVGTDGTIVLSGLLAGQPYTVMYTYNGTANTSAAAADGSGLITLFPMNKGNYNNIYVDYSGCLSNKVGPIVLQNLGVPPIPEIYSNSPVCVGDTLSLRATDSVDGLTYTWSGPAGFTATGQNQVVRVADASYAGAYTVSVSNGTCKNDNTVMVVVHSGVTLINVTADQVIPFGSSVQLNALGALYYVWTPADGSLNDPNINNPIATPATTTTYTVTGMNENGCRAQADVTVKVILTDTVNIPTAFTPNGDGRNDVFRVANPKFYKVVDFSVYNRWGALVYHNANDITNGWDGTYNGQPQDLGVYFYVVVLAQPDGVLKTHKGEVTLIR